MEMAIMEFEEAHGREVRASRRVRQGGGRPKKLGKGDVGKLFRKARRLGAKLTPAGSGHIIVEYEGKSQSVSATPRRGHTAGIRSDLRSIGVPV